jgi:predicted ester cyclase
VAGDDGREVIRRWNDEGWTAGNFDVAYELIAPTTTVHGAGGQQVGMGPEGFIGLLKAWRTGFPDGRMTIDDLMVDGELGVIRNTWMGTHEGDFYGVPPSGRRVAVTCIGIDRVVDGRVTEGWGELDMVGMMQSIGALALLGPGAVATGRGSEWGPSRAAPGPGLPAAEQKAMVVDFVSALSRGDGDALDEMVDPGFVDHNPVWGTTDLAGMVDSYALLRAAMPDVRFEVETELVLSEGDQAAAHSLVTGTHSGVDLFGAAPKGEPVTWTHTDVVRIAGGRIVERWAAADTMHLFQSIGAVPALAERDDSIPRG